VRERLKAEQISSIKEQKIFIDANVWLYIHCSIGNFHRETVSVYSNVYRYVLRENMEVYTDIIIISELINRYLRIALTNYQTKSDQENIGFKEYRMTEDGMISTREVYSILQNKILPFTIIINFSYDNESIKKLFDDRSSDIDFNDSHIVKLCAENGFYLMTHDGDFKDEDINIISHNETFFIN